MNRLGDFSVGTKVTMAKCSQYFNKKSPKDSFNPSGICGFVYIIWGYDDGGLSIGVRWDNGTCNGYNPQDLKILGQVVVSHE